MSAPVRIQRRRTKGYRLPEGAVYVGRPSRWGNPWPAADMRPWLALGQRGRMAIAVLVYRWWIAELDAPDLSPLRGHDLACWCPLCLFHADGLPAGVVCVSCAPCHADVLLELANR